MKQSQPSRACIARTATAVMFGLGSWSAGAQDRPVDAGEMLKIEEIMVTAQRREESLQDVPVAVTAVSAETLAQAQVTNISSITAVSPSIRFDSTNNAATSGNLQIRGIGTVGNNRAFEGAVGVFIDGVYRTRAGQALQTFLDVDSVQILRGPQGTLFGKNTSAGAFLLTSKAPSLDEVQADYELTASNYDRLLARAGVGLPINDSMAVRIAGVWSQSDGYIENPNGGDFNDSRPRGVKAQWSFEPNDDVSVRLIADWSEDDSDCCYGTIDAVDGPLQPLLDMLTTARGLTVPSQDAEDSEAVLSARARVEARDRGVTLLASWRTPGGDSLNSITAYRRWDYDQANADADFSGADVFLLDETFENEFISQEFTYNGSLSGFGFVRSTEYVIGAYFSDEDIDAGRNLSWGSQAQAFWDVAIPGPPGTSSAPPGVFAVDVLEGKSTSYAGFTHFTFALSDSLKTILGARYSRDEKEGSYALAFVDPAPNAAFTLIGVYPPPPYDSEYTDSALSGTVGLQYQISDDLMTYVSYSRGYKSGGVNIDPNAAGVLANNPAVVQGAVPLDPRYDEETVDGYEVGLKSEYLGGLARTNVAVFYDKLSDLQVAQFLGLTFAVFNAPDAEVYGAEVENTFVVTDALKLQLDATYLAKAEFGNDASLGILAGRDFARAPEFAGNAALVLDQPINDGWAITARASAQYSGDMFTNSATNDKQGAYALYDVSIGLRSQRAGWSLSAWCQNCSDKRYINQHFLTPLQGVDRNAYIGMPRTYGLTLRGSF